MKLILVILLSVILTTQSAVALQEPPPNRPGAGDRPPAGPERLRRARTDRRSARLPEWNKLPDEERKAIEGFLQEHFPRMGVDLERLKENSPQRFERRMNRVAQEMRRLMDASERDPRRATAMIRERQVSFQLQELARSYHQADSDDERTSIRKSVREMAGKEFDNRLERRQMEVRELETKLAELKTRLQESESVRDEMVDRRTRELLDARSKRDPEGDELDEEGAGSRGPGSDGRRGRPRNGQWQPRPEPPSEEPRPDHDDNRHPVDEHDEP